MKFESSGSFFVINYIYRMTFLAEGFFAPHDKNYMEKTLPEMPSQIRHWIKQGIKPHTLAAKRFLFFQDSLKVIFYKL